VIKKHQRFFNFILLALDISMLAIAYAVAYKLKWGTHAIGMTDFLYLVAPFWMIPIIILSCFFMDVYSPMRSRMFRKEVLLIIRAHLVGMVLIYSFLYLARLFIYSREMLIVFYVLGLLFMLLERYLVRRALQHLREIGYNLKHLLIIGAGPVGLEFARKVQMHRELGYNVVGFLDDDEAKRGLSIPEGPVLGGCAILTDFLENQSVDEVIIALPLNAYDKYGSIVNECEKAGVRVRIIPDFSKFIPGSPHIDEFYGIPLMNVRKIPLDDPFNKFLKRLFDIVIAAIVIILTVPVMFLITLGIKLTSPGPVFFRQERVGLNNRRFNMFKFRTMRVIDDMTAATTWTTADDPRKTKFGAFLRRTSLDEFPQFLNVLFGTMSVIGPRPERPFFVEQFKEVIPKYMVKHQVKPGITGWAQVNGWRGDTSIEKRIECDIYYIENWDLLFDVKILFLTAFKGLVNKNAY